MSREIIIFVTAPGSAEASRIAEAIVEERLAACVNIVEGIESIYRWEGKVTRDREALMIIKSTAERYEELERRVKQLHSYSTPEVIAFGIERGSQQYLDWLRDSTVKEKDQGGQD
ncbi:MAG TPA: divalent-cation tolerance protein CutA [Blastocatellia bacterium]|nr:divalent-cation tolerance protein CutA [Blastocatellia bacterium]